jgi:pSer/pThr/pTyr-binding forkhead associated (FHA) protein
MEDVTQIMPTQGTIGEPTQIGAVKICPICQTNNPGLEAYCSECGFLLDSQPGDSAVMPASDEDTLCLIERKSGRKFRLYEGDNSVGRENCDVLLTDSSVSRKHAQIHVEGSHVTVTDIGSTNGTMVNDVRLNAGAATEVSDGAEIRFGAVSLIMSMHGEIPDAVRNGSPLDINADKTLVGDAPNIPISVLTQSEPISPIRVGEGEVVAKMIRVDGAGADILMSEGEFTIGRKKDNMIVISNDPFVSGKHAEVTCNGGVCLLKDVGSSNGTLVNGSKLEPQEPLELHEGDEIVFGKTQYRFETGKDNTEANPEASLEAPNEPKESEQP